MHPMHITGELYLFIQLVSVQACSNVFCFVGFHQSVDQGIKYLETSLLLRNR